MSECVQEKILCDAINQEKIAYNETLDRLGVLKGAIENIQKLVEAKRLKLQSDFDTWYRQVLMRFPDDDAEPRRRDMANEDQREEIACAVRQPPLTAGKASVPKACGAPKPTQPTVETQFKSLPGVDASIKTSQPTVEIPFILPPGVKLTGNQQVDDDIIGFYKAKEVLLSKLKR